MVLSSRKEAVIYFSSKPGIEKKHFIAQQAELGNLALKDSTYTIEIWKPFAPGGVIKKNSCKIQNGKTAIELPNFVDDLVIHLFLRDH